MPNPIKTCLILLFFTFSYITSFSQPWDVTALSKIRNEGLLNSEALSSLEEFLDVYGQRLTGSREYYKSAVWMQKEMIASGLQNVHFEPFCDECRGWSVKTFNVEMTAPNYMKIDAYPLAMARSTAGTVEGQVVRVLKSDKATLESFTGKLSGKIVLFGRDRKPFDLRDSLVQRFPQKDLHKMENQLIPKEEQTPLPELLESFAKDDRADAEFLEFLEKEGALALLISRQTPAGILHPDGTYYYRESDRKPLPYFTIKAEHFGRLSRMLELQVEPTLRLNLETEFYLEPGNNVNIIGELSGSDPKLKSEVVLAGGHFDSWHSATGATDNGVNCVVLVEALRILKESGLTPKRTIRIGLWGGEEQAFIGSVEYAKSHFGGLNESPNAESKKVSAYLNLDNGGGAIRGIYCQGNEFVKPVFREIFEPLADLGVEAVTIENTLSTDHETFDHYGIPSFQFIQDELTYGTVTHHTNLDFYEYVEEEDIMKNSVILAWALYSIANQETKLPRKR